eukprot:Opistho-1_new@10707
MYWNTTHSSESIIHAAHRWAPLVTAVPAPTIPINASPRARMVTSRTTLASASARAPLTPPDSDVLSFHAMTEATRAQCSSMRKMAAAPSDDVAVTRPVSARSGFAMMHASSVMATQKQLSATSTRPRVAGVPGLESGPGKPSSTNGASISPSTSTDACTKSASTAVNATTDTESSGVQPNRDRWNTWDGMKTKTYNATSTTAILSHTCARGTRHCPPPSSRRASTDAALANPAMTANATHKAAMAVAKRSAVPSAMASAPQYQGVSRPKTALRDASTTAAAVEGSLTRMAAGHMRAAERTRCEANMGHCRVHSHATTDRRALAMKKKNMSAIHASYRVCG